MTTEPMYCIAWRAVRTGKTGQGATTFPKDEAERLVKQINKDWHGVIEHWAEPVAAARAAQTVTQP